MTRTSFSFFFLLSSFAVNEFGRSTPSSLHFPPETSTVRRDTVHPASYSVRRPRPTIINTPSRIQRTHPRLGETNAGKKRASSVSGLPIPGPAEARERARDECIRRHEQQRPHCQSSSHSAALAIRTCCNLPASMWLQDSAGPGGNVDSKLTTDNTSIGPIEGASSTLQYHHPIRCHPLSVRCANPLSYALPRQGPGNLGTTRAQRD
ncbi:hypothetical protein EDB80DRAFT_681910 [Ilyonectria destructans]|nr:hypothetical protein EDB80DRAFT_681910 [Ilyonectria destructans]